MSKYKTNRGFVQLIIIIILTIVILSLLNVSIRSFTSNTTLRENFAYSWEWITWLWNSFIARYFWEVVNFVKSMI